jgi:glycosyltransferase involved in cell wall biosynthesis
MNSVERGGAEKSILALIDYLIDINIDINLVLLFDGDDEYAISPKIHSRIVRLSAGNWINASIKLYKYLKKSQPALVYSLMPQSNIAALISCLACRIDFISSERTSPTSFYHPSAKLWLALVPHYFSKHPIFISHHAVDKGLPKGRLGRALKNRAKVLHNPIPQTISVEAAARSRSLKLERIRNWTSTDAITAKNPIELFIVSRLVPGKGIIEFIEAAKGALRDGAFKLTLAGDGPLAPKINSIIDMHGLQSTTRMVGFVTDMQQAFSEADVVVLPSHSEGFGRVGFEAYLAGCFVLGSPSNSFCSEITNEHPAWQITSNFDNIVADIEAIGYSEIPHCGRDIRTFAESLSVKNHGDRFLGLVGFASPSEPNQLEKDK